MATRAHREMQQYHFMGLTIHITVVLCAFALVLLICRYDMYDREPWPLMLLALCAGGFSAWGISYLEDTLIRLSHAELSVAKQALIASICEETCKVLIILGIAVLFWRHFNDPMDGIVYGALAGLGFALEESRFYLSLVQHMSPAPTGVEVFGQESIRLILHFMLGGLDGFGIGLMWAKVRQWRVILPCWIAASFGIHFLWDYTTGLSPQTAAVMQRSAAVMLMLFAMGLFGVAVAVGSLWSRAVHADSDDDRRLVRWPFTLLLDPTSRKLRRRG